MRSSLIFCLATFALGCGEVVAPALPHELEQGAHESPPTMTPPTLTPPTIDGGTCDASYDPCSPSPCFAGVECTVEDEWFPRCGACPDGMRGDGLECEHPPRLEISEIDYDQPGADTMEFIELMNVGEHPASTASLTIEFINGDNGQIYRRVKLDPLGELAPGALALVAMPLVSVPDDVPTIVTGSSAMLQNGPDAIRIVDEEGFVIDAIAYGGPVDGIDEEYHAEAVDSGPGSLARLEPGGPFVLACEPTPGLPNVPPCVFED
jgi:hypothetical protein